MRKIFVSSTFKDMQSERDLLHTDVIPELNNIARSYGESVAFIDLRWGVNTAELETNEGSKKVLSVCLDEIDKSKPYMLIFLGERYGWIPDVKLLKNATKRKIFSFDNMKKSVTALEIEYGALSSSSSMDKCIVCIRKPLVYKDIEMSMRKDYESESIAHKQRLDYLKTRIRKIFGNKIIEYEAYWDKQNKKIKGLDNLKDELIRRFIQMFESEWKEKEKLSWQEKEHIAFDLFTEEKSALFSGRSHLLSKYKSLIYSKDTKILILKGQAGSGKSCLISRLYQDLKGDIDDAMAFICGNSANSATAEDMLKQMVYFTETKLNITNRFQDDDSTFGKNKSNEEWQVYFTQLLNRYSSQFNGLLIFCIDALDQLAKSSMLDNFNFLPLKMPENIRFVLTCLDSFEIPILTVYKESLACETLPLLEECDISEVVDAILKANAKDLDKSVKDEIFIKESVNNPLYISMLLYRLMMMDSEDLAGKSDAYALNKYMINVIKNCPSDLDAMCCEIFREASERINPYISRLSAQLIASSRRGLRESDLEGIFTLKKRAYNSLDFSRFTNYMSAFFLVRNDGRYDFSHRTIRRGILQECDNKSVYEQLILQHIKTLEPNDSLTISEGIYHSYKCDDKTFACLLMKNAHASNQNIRNIIAKEVMHVCIDDKGKWICDIIDEIDNVAKSYSIVNFLLFEFNNAFDISKSQNDLRLNINLHLKSKLQNIYDNQQDITVLRDLCMACERVGNAYYHSSNDKKALEIYEEQIKYRSLLYEKVNTLTNLRSLSVSYERTGDVKINMGLYMPALKDYTKFHESLIEISDKNDKTLMPTDIPLANFKIGRTYMLMNNMQKAEEYFLKALSVLTDIFNKQYSLGILKKLSSLNCELGDVYKNTNRYKDAKGCYERFLDYTTQINIKENNIANILNISIANGRMLDIYFLLKDYNKAMELAQLNLSYCITLNEKMDNYRSLRHLSMAYDKIGNVYKELKDHDSALKAYIKCYEYRTRLYIEQYNYVNLRNLMTVCVSIGDIYRESLNYNNALNYYEEFLKHSLEFAKIHNDLYGMQNLYVAYNRMVLIYSALGNKESASDYTKKFNDLKAEIDRMQKNKINI